MKQAQFWFCFLFNKLVHKLSHIKDFFFFLITKWIASGDNKTNEDKIVDSGGGA